MGDLPGVWTLPQPREGLAGGWVGGGHADFKAGLYGADK